jgi:hypothetical protein
MPPETNDSTHAAIAAGAKGIEGKALAEMQPVAGGRGTLLPSDRPMEYDDLQARVKVEEPHGTPDYYSGEPPESAMGKYYTFLHSMSHNIATVELCTALANDKDSTVREFVSLNSRTPVELLTQLAADPDRHVREAVASNPSTPQATLNELAKQTVELKTTVAANHSASTETLTMLAHDADPEVRGAVAYRSAAPDVLRSLVGDPDADVRSRLTWNDNTPSDVLAVLATDHDPEVQYSAKSKQAEKPETPPAVLKALAEDPSTEFIALRVAGNPSATAETLAELAKNPRNHRSIVDNPNASADTLQELAKSEDRDIAYRAAKNLGAMKNANDPSVYAREYAAKYSAPKHILVKLASDPEESVRETVAANSGTPPATLSELATQSERIKMAVAGNPSASIPTVDLLSRDEDPKVRGAVARNVYRQSAVLERLASDPDPSVRMQLTENLASPRTLLQRLTSDPDEAVRQSAAKQYEATAANEPDADYKRFKSNLDERVQTLTDAGAGISAESAARGGGAALGLAFVTSAALRYFDRFKSQKPNGYALPELSVPSQ